MCHPAGVPGVIVLGFVFPALARWATVGHASGVLKPGTAVKAKTLLPLIALIEN